MRLKKGSKVEVLSKREVPSGSWWPAKILLGNGHNYHVRYDCSSSDTGVAIVERVSRKVIRPCPPAVGGTDNLVAGDIVEVFDNNSWKIAEVSNVVGGNYFFVRLLGSSRAFWVRKSDLRVRQSWKDNQWSIIGKDSESSKDGEANKISTAWVSQQPGCQAPLLDVKAEIHHGGDHLQELQFGDGSIKRMSQICSLHVEAPMGAGQKVRAIEKEGRRRRLVVEQPAPFPEMHDAVASQRTMVGENCIHASFNNRMTGFCEMGMERGITDANERCFIPRSLETSDSESRSCSVASCGSTNRRISMSPLNFTRDPNNDSDCRDDAESSCGGEFSRKRSFKELTSEIHKLELQAYRSTLEALFASGPLTWEQEAMVTNLRLMLHISNDEHLLELRHLVSAEVASY